MLARSHSGFPVLIKTLYLWFIYSFGWRREEAKGGRKKEKKNGAGKNYCLRECKYDRMKMESYKLNILNRTIIHHQPDFTVFVNRNS